MRRYSFLVLGFAVCLALGASLEAESGELKKVQVCHVPSPKVRAGKVIDIPKIAMDVHRAHGDCTEFTADDHGECRCAAVSRFRSGDRGDRG